MKTKMSGTRENTQNNSFSSHKFKGFQAIRLFSSYWNEYTSVGKSIIQPTPDTLHKDRGHTNCPCLLSDEVGLFSEAAARNVFSFPKGCHALYLSGASLLCCCSICVLDEIRAMH